MNKHQRQEQTECMGCDISPFDAAHPWSAETPLRRQPLAGRVFVPGEPIFHAGAPCKGIYCVSAGLVGLKRVDRAGRTVLMRLAYPKQIIGHRALLNGGEHRMTARAIKVSRLCFIDRATLTRGLEESADTCRRIMARVAEDLNTAEEQIARSVAMPLRERLGNLVMELDRYFPSRRHRDGTIEIDLPISRLDMADLLGVRPESISRSINELQRDGVALFRGRRVRVPDIARLGGGGAF